MSTRDNSGDRAGQLKQFTDRLIIVSHDKHLISATCKQQVHINGTGKVGAADYRASVLSVKHVTARLGKHSGFYTG